MAGRKERRRLVSRDFPNVEFVELAGEDGQVEIIVCGGRDRAERKNAARRYGSTLVEFGARFEDLHFYDVDDTVKANVN